jgi:K+ transporter
VTVKYVIFVLRADNKGEGGILALTSLALRRRRRDRGYLILLTLGIIGAALLKVDVTDEPRIAESERIEVERLGKGFFTVLVRYGLPPLTSRRRSHGSILLPEPRNIDCPGKTGSAEMA